MPARDGTGPLGQGPRSGRGMGNCRPNQRFTPPNTSSNINYPFGWFRRMWGNIFRGNAVRGRGNRINWR